MTGFRCVFLFVLVIFSITGADKIFEMAREQRLAGNNKQAVVLYDSLLKKDSANSDALTGKGYALLNTPFKTIQALKCFQQGLTISPENSDAVIGAALALSRLNLSVRAEGVLERHINRIKGDSSSLAYLYQRCIDFNFHKNARKIRRNYPGFNLKMKPDKMFTSGLNLSSSMIQRDSQSNWFGSELYLSFKPRHDLNTSFSAANYKRYDKKDIIFTGGFNYYFSKAFILHLSVNISDKSGFLNTYELRALCTVSAIPFILLQSGGIFYRHGKGKGEFADIILKTVYLPAGVKLRFIKGKDHYDEPAGSNTLSLYYSKKYLSLLEIGAGTGTETIQGSLESFTDQDVDFIFCNIRLGNLGRFSAGMGYLSEWRDSEIFRHSFTLSVSLKI